jgi:pSer/pThr/pTyr-binding forkhead associated (FHA) protein
MDARRATTFVFLIRLPRASTRKCVEKAADILQDLGSTNGTLYNGEALRRRSGACVRRCIQIGETEIVFDEG